MANPPVITMFNTTYSGEPRWAAVPSFLSLDRGLL